MQMLHGPPVSNVTDNMPPRIKAAFQGLEHIRCVRYVEFYSRSDVTGGKAEEAALKPQEQALYFASLDTIRQYVSGELDLDLTPPVVSSAPGGQEGGGNAPVHAT